MEKISAEIPIVMAADRNYLFPTSVAMMSILQNGDQRNKYIFYLLVNEKLLGMDEGLFSMIKKKFANFEWHYLTVPKEIFQGASLTNYHVTVETYYRLIISDLLPQYEKCLYLDGDIIVQCDVAELMAFPIGQNYLAAVKDIGMQCGQGAYYTEHQNELGFESMDSYFNAGVLVFNLELIRKDDMVSRFLKAIEKKYSIEDQDILNVTCLGRVCYLPVRYNVFSGFIGKEEFKNCGSYSREEMEDIDRGRISIIHYAGGKDKPWNNLRSKKSDLWWEYAESVPSVAWVDKKRNDILTMDKETDWNALLEKCRRYKHIVLYGYTYVSKDLVVRLRHYGIRNVRFFCDRNEEKIGQQFNGIACVPFEKVKNMLSDDCLFVICTQKACFEVREMLLREGVKERNIARYFWKDRDYFRGLDPRYYDFEIKQIYVSLQDGEEEHKALKLLEYSDFKDKIVKIENFPRFQKLAEEYFLEEWCLELPLVSIVIPAFNAEKYLDRCLKSILAQSYSKWECIVINDGSTDATEAIAKKWADKDGRFHCYFQKNRGMGPARNKGIEMAQGEYITFVDSDDWVEPDYVKDMYMAILKNGADICKSNFFFHDMSRNEVWPADVTEKIDVKDEKTYVHPNMWANMFATCLFRENGITMPGIPLEDIAIYPLLLLKAKKVVAISKPLYHYQINLGTSVMDNVKNMEYYPVSVEYLLSESKRLHLMEDNLDLFMRIAVYHMYGSLNSRIKNNCTPEEYKSYKEKWNEFLMEKFPNFESEYNFNQFWIWGSYNLSRIVANIPSLETYNLGQKDLPFYFGFASIIPLMENEKTCQEEQIPIDVDNVVRKDMLEKERLGSFKEIVPEKNDYLILDFLEERYPVFRLDNDMLMTLSDIWTESGYWKEKGEMIAGMHIDDFERWKKACDGFIELIRDKFKAQNIILVENYLASKCLNAKNLMLTWDGIEEVNKKLKMYYEYFEEKMPEIKILRVPVEYNYTSGVSKYGTDPSYLNAKAHHAMAVQLKEWIKHA